MSLIHSVAQAVYDQGWATALRESEIAFPLVQAVHVVGVVLTAGTIAIVDFRLLGWIFRDQRAADIAERLTPYTWVGFALMVLSGGALLGAEAVKVIGNIPLRFKLAALAIAGLNMAFFQWRIYARESTWGGAAIPPPAVRTAASISLLSWTAVIVTGRLIAYY